MYNTKNMNCVLRNLLLNNFFKNYLKNNVSGISAYTERHDSFETIQKIFNSIGKTFDNISLNYDFYDAFGSAYEQFKTDYVSNTGKNTGQHFTPVCIKEFIINELKPKATDKFYEPCCGSGGFIHTAYSYIHKNDEENEKKFKNNIYANECNPEIIKPLMINMLIHNIPINNIHERDSLNIFSNCNPYKEQFDVIATNPPFGMNTDHEYSEYWKPLKSGKGVVKNSTAQFIVHIVNSLKKNGRAGVVIDRGILNNGSDGNSWQKEFRKWLLKNTNLYKIVLLPTGIFDYTRIITVIIFFKKGEKTKKVEFYEGFFENEEKKSGLKINKNTLKCLTIEEIENQNWSLKLELEPKEELKTGWKKFGDVVEIKKGKTITKNEMTGSKYRVLGGGIVPMENVYMDEYNAEKNDILMSNDGYAGYINKFNEKMFITMSCNKIIPKENYNSDYIYFYLKLEMQNKLLTHENNGGYQTGQGLPHINKNKMLSEIQIPSLSTEHQKEIVDFLNSQLKNKDINLLSEYTKNIKIFELLINKQYNMCEDMIHLIYRKIETNKIIEIIEKDKKAIFNMLLSESNYEIINFGDMCDIKCGTKTNLQKYLVDDSDYGIIRTRNIDTNDDDILFISEKGIKSCYENCLLKQGDILLSSFAKPFHVQLIPNKWIGYTFNGGVFKLSNVNKKLNPSFFLNYIKLSDLPTNLQNISHGGTAKMFNTEDLKNQKIKIPSLDTQKKIIQELKKIDDEQNNYKKYNEMIQQFIDNMQNIINKIVNVTQTNNNDVQNIDSLNKNNIIDKRDESDEDYQPIKKTSKTNIKKIIKYDNSSEEESDKKSIKKNTNSLKDEKPKKSKKRT